MCTRTCTHTHTHKYMPLSPRVTKKELHFARTRDSEGGSWKESRGEPVFHIYVDTFCIMEHLTTISNVKRQHRFIVYRLALKKDCIPARFCTGVERKPKISLIPRPTYGKYSSSPFCPCFPSKCVCVYVCACTHLLPVIWKEHYLRVTFKTDQTLETKQALER